ncbi:redoxin domain-containing protein [Natrialbaceae archaeon A-CW3]
MPDFDVIELEAPANPDVGETAPDFTRPLVTQEFWADRSLSSLLEDDERVVLVFTPMVGSFVCQYVWDELAERGWDKRKTRIVGVTASTPYSISGFLEERDLSFEIIADPANEIAETYGIAHDLDGMTGISEPRLAFFAIDSDRRVEAAWVATEWPEFPEYDHLEATLELE